MNKPLNPSPWLLLDDPDLSPEQVWGFYAWAGERGCRVPLVGVVIADTAQQANDAVKQVDWTPVFAANETALNTLLARVEMAHVMRNIFGQVGQNAFLLVFESDESGTPLWFRWVRASSEPAARSAWPDLGESHAPKAVITFDTVAALRKRAREVRLARGVGATNDGRPFEDVIMRTMLIAREHVGEEAAIEAKRKFAEKMAGVTGSTP
jgi:hypothetical protein